MASNWTFKINEYRTRAILSRGLYIFYPIFHYGFYCRAVYDAEPLIFHVSVNATETKLMDISRVKDCASECQKSTLCDVWVFSSISKNCTLKQADNFESITVASEMKLKSGLRNRCFNEP